MCAQADVQLMWDNCKYFNEANTVYHKAAVAMEKVLLDRSI